MNTTTQNLPMEFGNQGFFARRNAFDWIFALLIALGAGYAFSRYNASMDIYEKWILVGAVPAAIWLGWFWRPLRPLMLVVALFALVAIGSYQRDLARAETVFWLKYFLSSQSAILWMCVLTLLSTVFYWVGVLKSSDASTWSSLGTKLAWAAVTMALIGTMVRWHESHLLGPDIGHIPVSNLYEVFVLFVWMTTLFYLYYEAQYKDQTNIRSLGAFVMLVISAAVGFLVWYSLDRGAHEIQPLVPALKSWWMKLHVPANFVGYGTFSLAAMVAYAYLLKSNVGAQSTLRLVGLWFGGFALFMIFLGPVALRGKTITTDYLAYPIIAALISFAFVWLRERISARLPAFEVLDDVMYKSIAVGFAFFTIATVLGALWAAEAWGGYWSWDPKETWALIVWLNYAAWLHMRLMKGLRGVVASWWALAGLGVTTFAFIGVNMFLSGLHSYGAL
jgi:cytochrome c-type biogenesis protein CcsB